MAKIDFRKAIDLEHKFAHVFGKQEYKNGVWLDKPLAERTIKEYKLMVQRIKDELEPILPLLPEMQDSKVKGEQYTEGVSRVFKDKGGLFHTTVKWFDPALKGKDKMKPPKKDGTRDVRKYIYPDPSCYLDGKNLEDVVCGPYCRVGYFKLELTSSDQVTNYLLSQGWEPDEYNEKKVTEKEADDVRSPYYGQQPGKPARDENGQKVYTSPKLTESSFDTIQGDTGNKIVDIRALNHRCSVLNGFLRNCRDHDGMVHQGAITHGANSGRCTHRSIVNVPTPSARFAKPCRQVLTAKEPYWNFGADIAGLEDRMKGHYVSAVPGGKEYAAKILDPEYDPHDESANTWGLYELYGKGGRKKAKPGNYALAYNGGVGALAGALGVDMDTAKRYYEAYWEVNKPLKDFDNMVQKFYKKHGYVIGLDGRKLTPRSAHSATNLLFQSGGNMLAKTATCFQDNWAKKVDLDGWQWSQTHDENQWLVHEKHIEEWHWFDESEEDKARELWKRNVLAGNYKYSGPTHVDGKVLVVKSIWCELLIKSFIKAGEYFNIRVPITGECLVGRTFAQTH